LEAFSALCQRLLEGVLLALLYDGVPLRPDQSLQLVLPSRFAFPQIKLLN
jgi:hypothetical protein